MSEKTNIAWCDSTVNFWIGCTPVSAGCKNCFAEEQDGRRFSRTLGGGTKQNPIGHWGKGVPRYKVEGAVKSALAMNRRPWICDECGEAIISKKHLEFAKDRTTGFGAQTPVLKCQNCGWSQCHRRRIFSLSLGDWLDEGVPVEWLAELLDTVRQCSDVTWILCTKRPENFIERFERLEKFIEGQALAGGLGEEVYFEEDDLDELSKFVSGWKSGKMIPNHVWLLASVENQAMADLRIPQLLSIPAACRGLSLEPLLGPVDLLAITDAKRFPGALSLDVLNGREIHHDDGDRWTNGGKIDWLIIGGESGPKARACNVEWIRSLVKQGQAAGVQTFVKQLGSKPCCGHSTAAETFSSNCVECFPLAIHDKKGGDKEEWPEDLQVQQWPKGF